MALGNYDANGFWHYGESDNIALFSDTLNKLADSASSAITSDRSRISTLEAGSLSGLIPIKPSAVTIATGTGGFNALGTVSFTGATAVNIDGIFSSLYRNYYAEIRWTGTSINATLALRFRASGADNTAASYGYTGVQSGSSSSGVFTASAQTSQWGGYCGTNPSNTELFIMSPQDAAYTNIKVSSIAETNIKYATELFGNHQTTAQFTGLSLVPASGNITGFITFYGIND